MPAERNEEDTHEITFRWIGKPVTMVFKPEHKGIFIKTASYIVG